MYTESAVKGALRFFVLIVLGSLFAALLGGAFGALVAKISPEFVTRLFGAPAVQAPTRYSFAVGMIWGLFIGAAVSGFASFLAAIIQMLRIRLEFKRAQEG